ncbi:MAG: family 43 glycosylhydrolase [Firmicutes bacterium]|nr:family 43 glycosylhydrolase [Bacillota bacterium]
MNRRQVRWLFLVVAVLFLAGGITDPAGSRVHADDTAGPEAYKDLADHNPIMTQRFGADPYAMVYDGRVYVYMTHDVIQRNHEGEIVENTYGEINSINCLSSDDMVNWTDHGWIQAGWEIAEDGWTGITDWARNSWAPTVTYKKIDGKDRFFLYFANSGNGIGVLTADHPVGPYTDPLGEALVTRATPNCADVVWLFDPAVLVDDDGKAYLYFGGGVPEGKEEMPNTGRVVQLGDDMISLAGTPQVVEAPWFFEAAFVNKIGDTYYYSYCTNWAERPAGKDAPEKAVIAYMTSDNPLGPWEYQGVIFRNPGVYFGSYGNNHHSFVEFNGKWYFFYHTRLLENIMGISAGYRSTHVEEMTITADGVIQPVKGSFAGVKQVKPFNPYRENEAETMAWNAGITTEPTKERSAIFGEVNMVVTGMTTGSFIGLAGVDFGETGPKSFTAKVASVSAGNTITIRIGDPEGEAIGKVEVPQTGSMEEFVEVTVAVEKVQGRHDLFFVFTGEAFAFDAWSFAQ